MRIFDIKEECGIFGIFNNEDAATNCVLGLHALQHRGQEGGGIVSNDTKQFYAHRQEGLVSENLNSENIISRLKGTNAIGHVRYSTSGSKKSPNNFQPIFAEFSFGGMAIAHNGNLTNARILKKKLIQEGAIFQSTMDTEVITHLIAHSKKENILDKIKDALYQIEGAYCLVILLKDKLIAVRDGHGVRPLCLGKLDKSWVVSSETCALDIVGAKFVRDIDNGEIIIIDNGGISSSKLFDMEKKFCIFEYIYFARPDSVIDGKNVYEIRKNIGVWLAKENKVEADAVVPIPDSGNPAAMGYSTESNIPLELGIIRNHYVGRTFIEPTARVRNFGLKLKHNVNANVIKNKDIILIDDSIVRGSTSLKIVQMLRDAGVGKIHMRISSPPTIGPCFYGIDTPKEKHLLANNLNINDMAKKIGVDSLQFISINGLYNAVCQQNRNNYCPQYCDACFTKEYPIRLSDKVGEEKPLLDYIQ